MNEFLTARIKRIESEDDCKIAESTIQQVEEIVTYSPFKPLIGSLGDGDLKFEWRKVLGFNEVRLFLSPDKTKSYIYVMINGEDKIAEPTAKNLRYYLEQL